MQLIDTHSHIFSKEFSQDRETVVLRAKESGIYKIILPAIDSNTHQDMIDLTQKEDCCFGAMGLHPTSVKADFEKELSIVEEHLSKVHKFCAIGEIGLDLYWSDEFFTQQKTVFMHQLDLSIKYDLPVIIHTREAFDEMYKILSMPKYSCIRGVFHGFTENIDLYKKMATFENFFFGIGGVVTFKNAILAETVGKIDLKRVVLETDSPYLTPAPYRGKRNESSYIKIIAEKISEIKGIDIEVVAETTTLSAKKLFNLN